MPESELRFVRRCAEFLNKEEASRLKNGLRGIYVLYKEEQRGRGNKFYDVQYIGMTTGRVGFKSSPETPRRSIPAQQTACLSIPPVLANVGILSWDGTRFRLAIGFWSAEPWAITV